MGFQEIPWVADRNPSTHSFYDSIFPLSDIEVDEISDLELTTGRKWYDRQIIENRVIEFMISDIGKIPNAGVYGFFGNPDGVSRYIGCKNSKKTRILDVLTEGCIPY